jgi:hypothetical protein
MRGNALVILSAANWAANAAIILVINWMPGTEYGNDKKSAYIDNKHSQIPWKIRYSIDAVPLKSLDEKTRVNDFPHLDTGTVSDSHILQGLTAP